MRLFAIVATTTSLIALIAGCSAPDDDLQPGREPVVWSSPQLDARNWTRSMTSLGCDGFCEPSIAIDAAGTVFVLSDGQMAVSTDGGVTHEAQALPPLPALAPPRSFQNDALIQTDAAGRLYFSALITYYDPDLQTLLLDGIQVASSGDRGRSWDVDTYLSAATTPGSSGLGADRQWLTFGAPDELYLSYQQVPAALSYHPVLSMASRRLPPPPGDVQVAASSDGGRTFTGFRNAVSATEEGEVQIIGMGSVADGRLFVPYLRYGEKTGAAVAYSDDQGATFRQSAVGPTGDFFPRLVASGPILHMVWKSVDDVVLVSSSVDGGMEWSAAEPWSGGNVASSPWAEARDDGGLDVVWMERIGEGRFQIMHRRGAAGASGPPEAIAFLQAPDTARSYTDFMHFARGPDDAIGVVYADMATAAVYVVTGIERPSPEA